MNQIVLLYTTFPDEETALAVGGTLVHDRLAACVNVQPGMRSVFRWKGEVDQGREAVALVKTLASSADAAAAVLKDRHPYDTPVIVHLGPFSADPETLAWVQENVDAT